MQERIAWAINDADGNVAVCLNDHRLCAIFFWEPSEHLLEAYDRYDTAGAPHHIIRGTFIPDQDNPRVAEGRK